MDFKKLMKEVEEDLETEDQKRVKAQIKNLLQQRKKTQEMISNIDRELMDLELKYAQGTITRIKE